VSVLASSRAPPSHVYPWLLGFLGVAAGMGLALVLLFRSAEQAFCTKIAPGQPSCPAGPVPDGRGAAPLSAYRAMQRRGEDDQDAAQTKQHTSYTLYPAKT